MTTSNLDAPTTSIDISDVQLADLLDNELTSERFTQRLTNGVLYGSLTRFINMNEGEEEFGWYRVTKNKHVFFFEGFLGGKGDESTPLFHNSLPLGTLTVSADSYFALLSMMFDGVKDEEPEFPSATVVVFQWVADQQQMAYLRWRYAPLFAQVSELRLFSAGGMCPFQAEGTLAGLPFYFRYRGDHMTLTVATNHEDIWSKPLYSASQEYGTGSGYGGSLGTAEFIEQFVVMVKKLERARITWIFEGAYTHDLNAREKAGEASTMRAWGHTADEAWDNLMDMGQYMETEEQRNSMKEYVKAHGLNPQTVTVDDRVFPNPEPDFAALVRNTEGKSE